MAGKINHAAAARPIMMVEIADIAVPTDRLRALKADQAAAIGAAIKADRQYEPIAVCQLPGKPGFTLVDGLHRLEGCRAVGLAEIEARLVPPGKAERQRQEVLSAWARADHDAFDMAAQVAAMVALARGAGADAHDEEAVSLTVRLATGWEDAAREALGISRANLFRYLKLHRFYDDTQKAILREAGMAGELVPLIRLAALPPEDFDIAFNAIAAGKAGSIADALALLAPAPVNGWDKQKAKVLKQAAAWQPHELRELIDELRALYRAAAGKDAQ